MATSGDSRISQGVQAGVQGRSRGGGKSSHPCYYVAAQQKNTETIRNM